MGSFYQPSASLLIESLWDVNSFLLYSLGQSSTSGFFSFFDVGTIDKLRRQGCIQLARACEVCYSYFSYGTLCKPLPQMALPKCPGYTRVLKCVKFGTGRNIDVWIKAFKGREEDLVIVSVSQQFIDSSPY
jgi:hypothetical protein